MDTYTLGQYEFYYATFDTVCFGDPPEFPGRTLVSREMKDFIPQIINTGGAIVDIVVCEWEGQTYLKDGHKRVLAYYALLKGTVDKYVYTPSDYKQIQAKVFINVHPDDQSAWAIILNQARTENPIQEWLDMRKLAKAGKWDKYADEYRLNKSHWNKMQVLENLPDPEFGAECFSRGLITMDNLFSFAKLDKKRQEAITGKLQRNEVVTSTDLKAARQAKTYEAVQRMALPTMQQLVQVVREEPKDLIFIVDPKTIYWWQTASQVKQLKQNYPNGEGYRLMKVC